MQLVKLGSLVLNMDHVRSIRDLSTRDPQSQQIQLRLVVEFDAHHAVEITTGTQELLTWLNSRAIILKPQAPL